MANRTRPNQILFFVSDEEKKNHKGEDGSARHKEYGRVSQEDGD